MEKQRNSAFPVVLFDWEGTLVDFQWDLHAATCQAQMELVKLGFSHCELPDHYALLRNQAVQSARRKAMDSREVELCVDAVYDHYDLDALSRWSIRPGVKQTLHYLKGERRTQLGLVTNVGKQTISQAIARFGLSDLFDAIVTRNDVELMKPSGEGIQRALRELKVSKQTALFVGDSVADILAAKDAGISVAIIQGGESAPTSLAAARPTFLWIAIEELKSLYRADGHAQ